MVMAHQFPSQVIEVGDRLASFNNDMLAEFHKYMADVHGFKVTFSKAEPQVGQAVVGDNMCVIQNSGIYQVVLNKYDQGKKIPIIRFIRGYKGWGLKESKDFVERTDAVQYNGSAGKPQVVEDNLSEFDANHLKKQLFENGATEVDIVRTNEPTRISGPATVRLTGVMPNFNDKISAIKIVRSFTGLGLRESKEMMDKVEAGKEQTITTDFPEDLMKQLIECNVFCIISR